MPSHKNNNMPRISKTKKIFRRRRAPLAKRMARIARSVFNKNVENKRLTVTISTATIPGGNAPSGGQFFLLNGGLSAGSTISQRVGNKIKISSVRFNGFWEYADSYNTVRMMVIWSRAPLDLSKMPTVTAPYDFARQPCKVLYDRTTSLESIASSGIMIKPLYKTIWCKVNGISTYDPAPGNPVAGFLNLYLVSDSALTQHPSFNGTFFVNYQDA